MSDCTDFARSLGRIMAESWENAETMIPADLAGHAQKCPHCNARLSAAMILMGQKRTAPQSPLGLEAKVMERVRRERPGEVIPIDRPRQQTSSTVRRFVAMAAAAALLVVATALIATAVVRTRTMDSVTVNLALDAPDAGRVAVVGDWNGWNPDAQTLADPDGDGVWTIRFRVERGREYRYQFVIDDELWLGDPNAVLQLDDGFGGTNSVLEI